MGNKDILVLLLTVWYSNFLRTVTGHGLDWTFAIIRIMKGACSVVEINLYLELIGNDCGINVNTLIKMHMIIMLLFYSNS